MEHKYTVTEIERLRTICENIYIWGNFRGPNTSSVFHCTLTGETRQRGASGSSPSYNDGEMRKAVEGMVRTYMLNGTRPDDFFRRDAVAKVAGF